jgi:DNA polymerase I-like protein with 3'-5' exonuclease and polymerase domains
MVRNPLGRVRHLPLIRSKNRKLASMAERQAINSPVQSTLSDLCLWTIAMAELELNLDREGLQIVGMTHDSIYGYIPIGQEHVVGTLADTMANLPIEDVFEWKPQLQFTVDAELGTGMGDLEKFVPAA